MTSVEPAIQQGFEPPGPGTWTIDAVHFPRPATRYWMEMHPEPFMRGFSEFTRFYGMLIDTLEYAYVNGFVYSQMRPISDDEFPERVQRAEEVFDRKLWRDQLREWDEIFKPASIAKHRELQAVDPDALSDAELAAHLRRCHDHHSDMIFQHMRFTGAAMVPIGDLLAHVGEWTGLPISHLLGMMRGTAEVSSGGSEEQRRLMAALERDRSARELVDSDRDAGDLLEELRNLGGETGAAVSAYLDLVGHRLLDGFDISGRYALELPEALLGSIRAAAASSGTRGTDASERIEDVREQVPGKHLAHFDELLEEARLMYRIRDERGVYSDVWASGIMRRGALAAGRRLAAKGRIEDPEHFVDADIHEMCAMLTNAAGPSSEELASRFAYRTTHDAKDAPPVLGPPPSPPPDPSGLPPASARVMRATGIVIGEMFGSSEEVHDEHLLRGLAASGGVYAGPARRVRGPAEFDRIRQGDVLVTESTTEAFNILLPLLGGLVTNHGGLLSHAAIVAREYGIPGVVGTRDATERIPDGAQVRVDGDAGEVRVRM